MAATRAPLSDDRWHFQHGPIDLVIGAFGDADATALAHEAAWQRFEAVLPELVAELTVLRQPLPLAGEVMEASERLYGPIAQRMWQACTPYRASFITPMAAVAGAVAQEIIACYQRPGIQRAWVNNGGDIAFHLTPGAMLRVGLFADLGTLPRALNNLLSGPLISTLGMPTDTQCELHFDSPVRGIATSGWQGRSFSRGIADSVTVLATTAAGADAAATVIANAVNVAHHGIVRRPACEVKDDSDLGALLVTVDVPHLPYAAVRHALLAGFAKAQALQEQGLIVSATLVCQGQWCETNSSISQLTRLPSFAPAQPLNVTAPPQVGSVFA
jgi:ApbE superfamily uncharacterized protein (UPF0280 family)